MAGNVALLHAAASQRSATSARRIRPSAPSARRRVHPTFTRDAGELTRALPTVIPPNQPTPLWQAVDKAIALLSGTTSGAASDGRPVVLVMSDSKDTGPLATGFRSLTWVTPLEIIDHAVQNDVMIYGIGVHSRGPMPGGNMMSQLVAHLPDPHSAWWPRTTAAATTMRPRDDLAPCSRASRTNCITKHCWLRPARATAMHKVEVKPRRKT